MKDAGWLFDLASILRKPVCELLETLPAQELLMWYSWLQLEPRGDKRADWHAAQVAKAAHDVGFGVGGKANPASLSSYLLEWKTVTPESQQHELKLAARRIFGDIIPPPKDEATP